MSDEERRRWDERYATGAYTPRDQPTPFVVDWLDRIPTGRALDVATGTGRNALMLAEAGYAVDAVDISAVAVDRGRAEAERRGLDIAWHVADLQTDPLPGDAYDLIVVARYRDPELWARLVAALAPDGWLLIEHHLETHRPAEGPSSGDFRLDPGELLAAAADLRVVHYSESVEPADLDRGDYVIARLAACNGDPGW